MTIIVTGGAGFIGSNIVATLEKRCPSIPIIIIDWLGDKGKWKNIAKRKNIVQIITPDLMELAVKNPPEISTVIHMGAMSSTTETDADFLTKWNINYTLSLFDWCTQHNITFVYASSASVYGNDGDTPLSAYAWSKKFIDNAIMQRRDCPPHWLGLRFFNVYGPNEYHKGSQSSMVYQTLVSRYPKFFSGDYKRDFIYVKDCCNLIMDWLENPTENNILDVGTGVPRLFTEIAEISKVSYGFCEMPISLKPQYQIFTKSKVRLPSMTLEEGIEDFNIYLQSDNVYR